MSKKASSKKKAPVADYTYVKTVAEIEEYTLNTNNLTVLFMEKKDTGVVTTNITYRVGARDEDRGETGVAHMLEHMLFKPTAYDLKHKIAGGAAMHFERTTGAVLNANTWKDRTTYYFSYPSKYVDEALRIEADRMCNVILTDKTLKPEQGNVLSEFDMYNGDPHFALEEEMRSIAFLSHPYGHETLGYRKDIEAFSAEKLDRFYKNYYRPDNATMMIVGDIDRETALTKIKEQFSHIENPSTPIPRYQIVEKAQEGVRRAYISRPSSQNIVGIGFKHAGFPSKEWFTANIMLDVLAGGPESILQKALVDTNKAINVGGYLEPTSETNLAIFYINFTTKGAHTELETEARTLIADITAKDIKGLVQKSKANMITGELFGRTDSLQIVGELTEYISADAFAAYENTPKILESITVADVMDCLKNSFVENNLTIGHFTGIN